MADKAQELETRENANAQADSGSQKEENAHTPALFPTKEIMTTLSGRVRKIAQVFTFTRVKSDDAGEFTPPVGKGVKVRDVEYVRENVEALGKQQCEMIRQLYSIMFGRRFQQKNMKAIKEHILDFSGTVEQDEKSREYLVAKMSKWKMPFVHDVMDLLAVDRSKKSFDEEGKVPNKEALLERLVEWLYNPQKTKLAEKKFATLARKAKQKTKKRAKAAKKSESEPMTKKRAKAAKKSESEPMTKKRAKTAIKSESEPVTKKRKTTKKKSVAVTKGDDADNLEATESEGEESCSDFEDVKKKTAKKRKVTNRTTASRVVGSDNDDDVSEKETGKSAEKSKKGTDGSIVKCEKQSTAEEKPVANSEDEASIADKANVESEMETLDTDTRSKIRDIIAKGNAEELTVKKILRQLSADLGRDMSAQKNAIKEFITNDQAET